MDVEPITDPWANEALGTTILRGVVGSTAHGLQVGNQDDRDEMGVCLPSPRWVLGYPAPTHYTFRTAKKRQRSGPGDLDLTIYSLRRYVHLLLDKANPTCQVLLWLPTEMLTVLTPLGDSLRACREDLICQKLGRSFLGYMNAQLERLTGKRGQRNVTRLELVEAHGYDTKYAGHVIRLGVQGLEMAQEGRLSLPMDPAWRECILEIRRGERKLRHVVAEAEMILRELEIAVPKMPMRPSRRIEEWAINAHLETWRAIQKTR